ncbi:UNVERIFIED_CONTAM: Beta-amyrin 28-monooxygenase [Sesamum radiatum]|uniref:Beta-amyrin 28-monooxygenase n=1 Tax=Sesamum radiatum TaxID=300843 RepID=A0AAW2PX76_SESRA
MLGENMEFAVLGPQKFVKDRMEKYSPEVFQTSLLGEKMAIFCGAQDLPGTAYNRAIKGGKMVREELMRIITERRKELTEKKETEGRDLLSKMLLVTDEDGQFLSEMEISNNIIGLLVASFETTSSAVTAVMNYLAELPHIYKQVLEEQMEIAKSKGPDELLTWEDIEKMKHSWNVARESLRLTPLLKEHSEKPQLSSLMLTFWTVHSSHKNPKYFPEPEKFDPSRFEGSGPAPYTFVPFGGGPRMCPGKEYARLEVLVFMHNVVRRFRLEKAIPNEKIVFHASPTPAYGLPVHLRPHEK